MPLLVTLLGALMLMGGVAALILGLPYLVLERGFTQVIMGSVVATGGVVVMVGGMILREVRQARLAAASSNAVTSVLSAPAGLAIAASAILAGTMAATSENADAKDDQQPMLPFIDAEDAVAKEDTQQMPAAENAENQISADDNTSERKIDEASDVGHPQDELPIVEVALEKNIKDAEMAQTELAANQDALPQETVQDIGQDTIQGIIQDTKPQAPRPVAADTYADLRNSLQTEWGAAEVTLQDEPVYIPSKHKSDKTALDKNITSSEAQFASSEGIVSVRQIGESTYTMFSDGTVRAATPTGERMFNSISELKEHLAQGF